MVWSVDLLVENHFFVCYHIKILVALCLRYYLNSLLVNIRTGNPRINSVDGIKVYRELQLMIRFFNGFHQDMFISILILMVGACFVVPLFTFITANDAMTIPQFFIFGTAIFQVPMCITIAFGTFGGIYDDSVETIQSLRAANSIVRNKIDRKICAKSVRSLGPLKVMVGSVNFFDKLTPMTFVDFCIDILVNLLLLK